MNITLGYSSRLLVLSPFPAMARRPTAELAAQRDELVADLAQRVFIAHAAPGSKTEAFAAISQPLASLFLRWTARQTRNCWGWGRRW